MRKVAALGLAIWWVGILPGYAEGTRYHHPDRGFTLEFPEGWIVREDVPGTHVFGYDPKSGGRVNVCTDTLPEDATAESYGTLGMGAFEQLFTDFKPGAKGKATIAGEKANWYVFSGKMGKISFSTLEYFVVRGGKGYAINCSADPKHFATLRPGFERIVQTFALDPAPVEAGPIEAPPEAATSSATP